METPRILRSREPGGRGVRRTFDRGDRRTDDEAPVAPAPVVACGGRRRRCRRRARGARGGVRRPRGRERVDPAHAHDHARGVPRRRRALRHLVRIHRQGQGSRLDRAAAGRAAEGRAGRRLDAAAPRARGRAADRVRRSGGGGAQGVGQERGGHPLHQDRRARHHRVEGRRRRGRQVGDRARLPAHTRRARDARLLRRAQPDLHGGALRRVACGAARAEHR